MMKLAYSWRIWNIETENVSFIVFWCYNNKQNTFQKNLLAVVLATTIVSEQEVLGSILKSGKV